MKQLHKVIIRENSFLAKLAAMKLKTSGVALTLGNKIHLHNVTSEQFLNDEKWVNHELIHVMQFRKYGYIRFICMYMIESLKKGYYDNKFEIEARREEGEGRREEGGWRLKVEGNLEPATCSSLPFDFTMNEPLFHGSKNDESAIFINTIKPGFKSTVFFF
jgi:hypothetical protein